jgi:small subunit ribosomal protein S24e
MYGFKTAYGGGKSSGMCLVYNDVGAAKKFEPKFRLARNGLAVMNKKSAKQRKERKNRSKKRFGEKKWSEAGK